MIKSFSSCIPGSIQTTSWVQSNTCDFLGNFSISVEGPQDYSISSTLLNYQIDSQNNLSLYFQVGKEYKFTFNCVNDPVVIFNSSALPVPFTTEVNYYDSTHYVNRDVEPNSPYNFSVALPIAVPEVQTITPTLPYYPISGTVDVDIFGAITGTGTSFLTELGVGDTATVDIVPGYMITGIVNNVTASLTPVGAAHVYTGVTISIPGGPPLLRGDITIEVQSRINGGAWAARINNRCSVPGGPVEFKFIYQATNKYLLSPYDNITWTIVGVGPAVIATLTGTFTASPFGNQVTFLINQITGPDQTFTIEFRDSTGTLFHTTAVCTIYSNNVTYGLIMIHYWSLSQLEVNRLPTSFLGSSYRLTNILDFTLTDDTVTLLNLYYQPPTNYRYEIRTIQYTLPILLNPSVWEIYLIDTANNLQTLQTLGIDYDIVGTQFYWDRLKTFPLESAFVAIPMVGQLGEATWKPTIPGIYSYKSYVNPTTHYGTITVTAGPYVVPANTLFSIKERLTVKASFIAPAAYLDYKIYSYSLCDLSASFVVVTQNNYNPLILVKDRLSRWYNYYNDKPTFSFALVKGTAIELTNNHDYLVHYGVGIPDLKNDLIFLNHIESHINFYSGVLRKLITVKTPTSMIQYERIKTTVGSVTNYELLLLGINGKLYKLKQDLTFVVSAFTFFPVIPPTAPSVLNSDMIGENQFGIMVWPSVKSTPIFNILFPNVKYFSISPTHIFLAGGNILRVCDYNFAIVADITLPEPINTVTWFYSFWVIVTTEMHNYYLVRFVLPSVFPQSPPAPITKSADTVIGFPARLKEGAILIPYSHDKKFVLYTNYAPPAVINLSTYGVHDFIMSYARNFDGIVYVTGHDTNKVIAIDSQFKVETTEFHNKVTTVDVCNGEMLVSHYMKSRQTLDLSNIKKIMPFTLEKKYGASSFVSSDPKQIKLLGKEGITCIPGPYASWWTNGTHQQLLRTDDFFSVTYKGSFTGNAQTYVIIGETAIDFAASVFDSSNQMIDFFDPAPPNGINMIGGTYTYVSPDSVLGAFPLPYPINFFGTSYSDIQVTYNGVIGFDNGYSYNTRIPSTFFTAPLVDALVIEPIEGWPGYPIDNSDVTNIKYGTLEGGVIPGVYIDVGFVQAFAYYKFKYVGTLASAVPNGNVRVTRDITQIGSSFNFVNTTLVLPGQTVSNIITSAPLDPITFTNTLAYPATNTVKVTAVYPYSLTRQSYFAPAGGYIVYLSTSLVGSTKKYANITTSSGTKLHGYVDSAFDYSSSGNAIIKIDPVACKVTMTGLHHPSVTSNWIFDFVEEAQSIFINLTPPTPPVTTVLTTLTKPPIYRAQSIGLGSLSFYPIKNETNTNAIVVSTSVYSQVYVNQILSSSIFNLNGGQEVVTDKWVLTRSLRVRVWPQAISATSSSNKRIYVYVGKTNLPDGVVCTFELIGPALAEIVEPVQVRYYTPIPPAQPKLTSTAIPITTGTTYHPTEFKNTGSSTAFYNAGTSTYSFNFSLYGDATEINIDTNTFPFPYSPLNAGLWKFRITTNYTGTPVSLTTPVAANAYFSYRNSYKAGYIPGSGSLPAVTFYEYTIGFDEDKNIYNPTTTDLITSDYTEYQFYPGTAVSALLATMNTSHTIAVINSGIDITETRLETRINYRLHTLTSVNPVKDTLTTTNNSLATLTMSGSFIDLDYPQTLSDSTSLLFKHVYPHPVTEYEFAIYWGKNYQYIEYNFNSKHRPALIKGLTSSNGFNESITVPPLATGNFYSYVWASLAANGIFQSVNLPPYIFGNGVFTPNSLGSNQRLPRMWQVDVNQDNILRYDIIIDSKYDALTDIRCSVEYGKILVNGVIYDGSYPVVENDIISLYFFFGDGNVPWTVNKSPQPKKLIGSSSFASSTVVFSLGSTQYNIPIAPEPIFKTTPVTVIDVNYGKLLSITETININMSGVYHIPNNYRNASGVGAELVFTRTSGMTTTVLENGMYHGLITGDTITITNIFTSSNDNDRVEIVISGPEIIKLRIHTPNVYTLVNYFTLPLTSNPFTQLTRPNTLLIKAPGYEFLDETINVEVISTTTSPAVMPVDYPKILDDSLPFFSTSSIVLTSSLGSTSVVNLYVDTFGTGFKLNGNSTSNNSILYSTYTDEIAVEWNIKSYLDTRAVVYQIEQDAVDGSNIYIEVGEVLITPRNIDPIVKSQGNEISNTISFTDEFLNNALIYFDMNVEVIQEQKLKTISPQLKLTNPPFSSFIDKKGKLSEQNTLFTDKNELETLSYDYISSITKEIFKNNFQADFSSKNDSYLKRPPIFFTSSNKIQKLQFDIISSPNSNRKAILNFTNVFNITKEKFYLVGTTFTDTLRNKMFENKFVFIQTQEKFADPATIITRFVDKVYQPPAREYKFPVKANSRVWNITEIPLVNKKKLIDNPTHLKLSNFETLFLAPVFFTKKNFESVFLAPVFFVHTNELGMVIPQYKFDRNLTKFLIAPEQFTRTNFEKHYLPPQMFTQINNEKVLIAAESFEDTNFPKPVNYTYFLQLNDFRFSPQGETFIDINYPTFLPIGEYFTHINDSTYAPAGYFFTSTNDSEYLPSIEPYIQKNDSSLSLYPTTFERFTSPTYQPDANSFYLDIKSSYRPSITQFSMAQVPEHAGITVWDKDIFTEKTFVNIYKSITDSLFNPNSTLEKLPISFEVKKEHLEGTYLQEEALRNTAKFIGITDKELYANLFGRSILEEFAKNNIGSRSVLEEFAKNNIGSRSILEEFEKHGILPPFNEELLTQRLWLVGNLNLGLERHGLPTPFLPETERHGIPTPFSPQFAPSLFLRIPLPPEFETHGVLPPFNEELLAQRLWLVGKLNLDRELHGMPVPLPPELERHGIPVPLPYNYLPSSFLEIPLPPEYETHGVLPPFNEELLAQRLWLVGKLNLDRELHGTPVPLPPELNRLPYLFIPLPIDMEQHGFKVPLPPELEYHGIPIPLPPELEYHGIPIPLPPELEYHGIPIPLPPELEYHGIPIPLPPELEYHGIPIPLPPELEYHGIPIPLPPELEYHGIPIPLPPELEYHGIPIPLPPELEYHGIPIPLPPELEYHGVPFKMPALLMKQNTSYYNIQQNWQLFQEVEWNNDNPFQYGAYRTDFKIYVNEGKNSDYKGYPPFVTYNPTSGSALLSKGLTYGLGSFPNPDAAAIVAAKYVSAGAIQIVGTSYWNYRIFFDKKIFAPTKSMIFPRTWLIKGG